MKMDKAKKAVDNLYTLFKEPEEGLLTWNQLVGDNILDLLFAMELNGADIMLFHCRLLKELKERQDENSKL